MYNLAEVSLLKLLIQSLLFTVGKEVSKCNSSIVGGEDSSIFYKNDVGASCFYRIEV